MSHTAFPPDRPNTYPSKCFQCQGTVIEQDVNLVYPRSDGPPRLVNRVPAGVCDSCGEQYLRPETAEIIEKLLAAPPARHEEVPVWDFAAGF
jgi:YgiT-type zinc finger domain-containing protein